MKKYIKVTLTIICIFILTACAKDKKIVLPDPEDIMAIEIKENTSENVKKITDKEKISKLINEIANNSKFTNYDSLSECPANIDNYIIIEFEFHRQSNTKYFSTTYLYEKRGNTYIELPYEGIWKLNNEVFNTISNYLSE